VRRSYSSGMAGVTLAQALGWRMRRQYLTEPGPDVVHVTGRLCGVQAQVASAAQLALAIRLDRPVGDDLERALYGAKALVKLWAARGTLHLLRIEQAARFCAVHGALRMWERPSWLRGFGVSRAEMDAILAAVADALPGRVLTREELVAEIAERAGSAHLAQSLSSGWGSLLKPATYSGLLCHGPPSGNRVTFTSPATWLSGWRLPDADEAGRQLARDYLAAYGPAGHDDFAQWLFRNIKPALTKRWFAELVDAGELAGVDVDGRQAFVLAGDLDELAATAPAGTAPAGRVRLLGAFDQYVIAVSRELIPKQHRSKVSRTAGWISPVVLVEGRIAGVWNVDGGELAVEEFEAVPKRALAAEAKRLERLLAVAGGRARHGA
jgi:hypothetical protein